MRTIAATAILMSISAPLAAQQGKPLQGDQTPRSGDIVVEALLPPGEKPATSREQETSDSIKNRVVYENSARIARCAIKQSLPRLRAAIDGALNSAPQREAQAWLIRRTLTCNADTSVLTRPRTATSTSATTIVQVETQEFSGFASSTTQQSVEGTLIYDRGALLEEAIAKFAPDIDLTRDETNDPAVQARFNQLEEPRNRFRLEADYKYFEVVVCMVRLQPKLSTQLLRTKRVGQQGRLQSAIINNARVCVGNAKHVYVDPSQFRAYIVDALYRWVVAARGVKSLLPQDDSGQG